MKKISELERYERELWSEFMTENDSEKRKKILDEYYDVMSKRIDLDNKRVEKYAKIANVATPIASVMLTSIIGVLLTGTVLKFEETGSINSFVGRSILGKLLIR